MAQGKSPRNPLAFAPVLYPGRCLASQPTGSGGEFAVALRNRLLPGRGDPVLLSPPLLVLFVFFAQSTAPASALASAPASAPAAAPAAESRGGGFVVDLPYQIHDNYESGEI